MRKSTKRFILRTALAFAALAAAAYAALWLWHAVDWAAVSRWSLLGLASLLGILVLGNFLRLTASDYRQLRRREQLLERYGDTAIVDDLLAQVIWEGEHAEQVRESLGDPVAVDAVARRTKKQEVWKYGHEGGNRYRLRITLDNDQVVRWDMRT